MKYSHIFTLTALTCVLGHESVQSFSLDLSSAVKQIRKGVQENAAGPYLQTARRLFPAYVRKFQQSPDAQKAASKLERQRNPFSSFLLHGAPIQDFRKLSDPFSLEKCDGAPEPQIMEIKSFSLKPYPVHFPGDITFSFEIEFHDTISDSENVTVALEVYAKTGSTWLEIPCLGQVGSCTYVDFCTLIKGNTCPQELTKQGVPCNCPFNKGTYKLNDFTVQILAEVLLPDNYKARVKVSSDQKGAIACYDIKLTAN